VLISVHLWLDRKGQAMVEYVLLVCVLSLFMYTMVNLFGKFIKLVYQDQTRQLGYEIPAEKDIAQLQKDLIILKMQSEVMKDKMSKWQNKNRY
jgi:Flp pilus assembly pilin Flp